MGTNKTLKAAVIGVGSMGKNHARVYSELMETRLVGVADINHQVVDNIARIYGGNCYLDYREMLVKEKPDIVSIVVDTIAHAEVGLTALAANAHILIEKPIAATIPEAQSLIEAAKNQNRQLMIGHIMRFNPAIELLKEKLNAEELGQIFQINARRTGPFPSRIQDVGVVIDLAPHDLDLMCYLTGEYPSRIYAETANKIHTRYEDILSALIRFPQGIIGTLDINWLTPTKVREMTVLGERGMFHINSITQDFHFFENDLASGSSWPELENIKGVSIGQVLKFGLIIEEPLKRELRAFARAIINGEPVPINGEDGLNSLRLSHALIESGKRGTPIYF